MYYFFITLIFWLLLGANSFAFSFNPVLCAFALSLILDILANRNLFIKVP